VEVADILQCVGYTLDQVGIADDYSHIGPYALSMPRPITLWAAYSSVIWCGPQKHFGLIIGDGKSYIVRTASRSNTPPSTYRFILA
jgi:hypothetical protein